MRWEWSFRLAGRAAIFLTLLALGSFGIGTLAARPDEDEKPAAKQAQSSPASQSQESSEKKKPDEPKPLQPGDSRPTASSSSSDARVTIEPRQRPQPATATEESEERRSNIRVESKLVLIPVTVMDPMNRSVTGLEKDSFKLFEDKVEQEISQFSSEDSPITVGIVFDASGSMGAKLQKSRQAVAQFFRTANPEDEFFLIQFNDRPQLTSPLTHNTEEIQNALTFTQAKGRTALLDGIYMAMRQMKKAKNPRKAILVISDGGDNSSRYTETEVRNAVREADVQIYAIGIFEPIAGRGRSAEEIAGPGLLSEMAEQTGGRHYAVENLAELPDIAAKIGIELRNHYVLGYSPKNLERDGKYRRVKVTLAPLRGMPPLRAYFRLGYYAPSQ